MRLLFILLFLIAGCSRTKVDVTPFCKQDEEEISRIIQGMTLKEKVGQLFITGIYGLSAGIPEETEAKIREFNLGGAFLSNIENIEFQPEKTKGFINELQGLSMQYHGVPLFLATDQEGGFLQNVASYNGGTDTPGNMALGATRSPALAESAYSIMGYELRNLGINMDYAPVVDVVTSDKSAITNTRSFGGETNLVSLLGQAAVRGLHKNLVTGSLKHFPGYSVEIDPHKNLPFANITEEELWEVNLPPYIDSIRAGADLIMVGHVLVPAVDPTYPASVSYKILTGILREKMGYDGLVVTDDMGMGALNGLDLGDYVEVLAVMAGCDLLLMNWEDYNGFTDRHTNVLEAVESGKIPEQRIDESLRRILRAKMKYCLFEDPYPMQRKFSDGKEERTRESEEIAEKTIVMTRNEEGLIPLDRNAEKKLLVICPQSTYMSEPATGWMVIVGDTLGDEISSLYPGTTIKTYNPIPDQQEIQEAVSAVDGADIVVIASFNAHYSLVQRDLIQKVLEKGKPTILVALGVPYDIMDFPSVNTFIASLGQSSVSLRATAMVLFGMIPPAGTMPVLIP